MFYPMKPETAARREKERAARMIEDRADLRSRLAAMAEKDPDGIWSDLLAMHDRSEE